MYFPILYKAKVLVSFLHHELFYRQNTFNALSACLKKKAEIIRFSNNFSGKLSTQEMEEIDRIKI